MNATNARSEIVQGACARTIYNVMFRLTSISDLYGPDKAVEWAQSVLEDPQLRAGFARSREAAATPQPPSAATPAA